MDDKKILELMKSGDLNMSDSIGKLVTNNNDGTYSIKMPGDVETYVIKELTKEEENKAVKLAGGKLSEEDMIMVRMIVSPKVTTDEWLKLPAKIPKRLEYVRQYLEGVFDFLG